MFAPKNKQVALSVDDVKNFLFWKIVYFLLRGVFPILKAIQSCDSNVPAMDKIYFLVDQA